jgi:nitroreductase
LKEKTNINQKEGEINIISAINNRRSIRRYQSKEVSRDMIEEILQSAILAPSAKNRQPWRFIVATGNAKKEALAAMRKGLIREQEHPLLAGSVQHLSGAEFTLRIMEQAPVLIFIVNPYGIDIHRSLNPEERIYELCNTQSIGAAIENMTLTATELGLGSLWICDTYFAYQELCEWLNTEGELLAAMTVGYSDEAPAARPRKEMAEVVEWRD